MQDFIRVHVVYGLKKIFDNKGSSFLWKNFVMFNERVELTITTQLHQGIEMGFILKKPIKGNDVGMVEESLDF